MPHAVLSVQVPDRVWIGDLSRRYPDTVFRILAAYPGEESGVAMVEVESTDAAAVIRDLEAFEEVAQLDLLRAFDEEVLLQLETTEPVLLVPLQASGAMLDLPFEVQDGEVSWQVTTTRERLSTLGDQLETLGIEFEVESVARQVEPDRLLTDRQETLVHTAVDAGYYEVPRTCTLTDVADAAGIAKSTASETLHRAEEAIVKDFVENLRTMQVAN